MSEYTDDMSPRGTIAGKLIILFIFGVAIGMAVFAWWYRYEQGNESLAFWGADNARLISGAEQVALIKLSGDATSSGDVDRTSIDGRDWVNVSAHDLRGARGFLHARHSLVEDATFRWDEPPADSPSNWDYVVEFWDTPDRMAVVAFDLYRHRVRLVGTDREVAIQPDIAEGFRRLFERESKTADTAPD